MLLNTEKGTHPLVLHAAGKVSRVPRWIKICQAVLPRLQPVPQAEVQKGAPYYQIITWNTGRFSGMLERCCHALGVPLLELAREKYAGGGWLNIFKAHTTLAAMADGRLTAKYVIGLDAWDVLLAGDPRWIAEEFRSHFFRKHGKKILFNAAATRYPMDRFVPGVKAARAADIEAKRSRQMTRDWKRHVAKLRHAGDLDVELDPHWMPNCYLNAGVYVAQRSFLKIFLERVIANWEAQRHENDGKYAHSEQAWVKLTAWADFPDQVGIDSGNRIFQHMRDGIKTIACPDIDVFIDLGANTGDTVRRLRGAARRVYAWEPNADLLWNYEWPQAREEIVDLRVLQKAAWIRDEVRTFAIDSKGKRASGSSLCLDKTTGRLDCKREVECVDFSLWLRETVRPGDKVRLKMDIEGAEYEVLPKMLEDGTISLVQELIIEWHDWKVGVEKVETKRLTALIKQAGVRILRWK